MRRKWYFVTLFCSNGSRSTLAASHDSDCVWMVERSASPPMHRPSDEFENQTDPGGKVKLAGKLGEMSLLRQVLSLAIWPLLEQILAFFVGTTDLLIAGRMSEGGERVAILDALALGGYVGWFTYIFQGAVATGVMALVSRAVGARDVELSQRGLGQGIWLGLMAGVVGFFVLKLGGMTLIRWMGLEPAAAIYAIDYIEVFACSSPVAGAMFAVNAALRGAGDTKTPFLAMLVVNVVNVGTSILFVFGSKPFGGMGVKGIALGTVMGWLAGLITVIAMLIYKRHGVLSWTRRGLKFHAGTLIRIWRIGVPQAIEIAGMWMIHSYGLRVISNLNKEGALGAHFIAVRLESMSYLPGFAIAAAAAALTGQYLGAGSREMAVKAVRYSWVLAIVFMSIMGLSFFLGRIWLIGTLAPGSAIHLQLAEPLLMICAVTQPFFATCIILKTTMRGAGATKLVMFWAFGSMLFDRVGVLWFFTHFGTITLTGVWIALCLDLVTQSFIFSILHFRGKWLHAKV